MSERTINVLFVGDPNLAMALREALTGLERIKHARPEDAAWVAEATIRAVRDLTLTRLEKEQGHED